jgi:hypothetical protein
MREKSLSFPKKTRFRGFFGHLVKGYLRQPGYRGRC